MKPGRNLERLIATLEKALGNREGATVQSPCRLPDRRTGAWREHDVVVTFHAAHHTLRVAIECRDRKRPVGVPQVEAFYQKCLDTEAKPVMVSSSGFFETARKKGESLSIRCLDLSQVDHVDWVAPGGFLTLRSKLEHLQLTVYVKEQGVSGAHLGEFLDAQGRSVSQDQVRVFLQLVLVPEAIRVSTPGRALVPFNIGIDGLFVRSHADGEPLQVNRIQGTAHYSVEAQSEPFHLLRYEEKSAGNYLAEAAVANISQGPIRGKLVLSLDSKRNVTASFINGE